MSVTYGFYNSLNGDRKYNSLQIAQIFDGIIYDGVFISIGDRLTVAENEGMTVVVKPGRAWFDHTWTLNDADYPITAEASNLLLPRIDAVILEINETNRENNIKFLTGTAASSPQKPTLTNSADIHQYALAYVTIPAGSTEITRSQIENAVGTSGTPYATGVMQTMDIDELIAQWNSQWTDWTDTAEDDFTQWFNTIKGQLGTDAAGNLQNQIDNLYKGTFLMSGWVDRGDHYEQSIPLSPVKSGSGAGVTSNSLIVSPPMVRATSDQATNERLLDALSIINAGYCSVISANRLLWYVFEIPESDVEVVWLIKDGEAQSG